MNSSTGQIHQLYYIQHYWISSLKAVQTSQASAISKYKNIKSMIFRGSWSIYFIKQSISKHLILNYMEIEN